MKKMIIFLSLIVVLFAQINYKSQAQTVQPTSPAGVVFENPGVVNPPIPSTNPTSYPDTGTIQAGDPCKGKPPCSNTNPLGCCPGGQECSINPRPAHCRAR